MKPIFKNQWPLVQTEFDSNSAPSRLDCSLLCKQQDSCVTFFYDDVDKMCLTSSTKYNVTNFSGVPRFGAEAFEASGKRTNDFTLI